MDRSPKEDWEIAILFEFIVSIDPIVQELFPNETVDGMCGISLLRDATRQITKTAACRGIRKAMRNRHLASNRLWHMRISLNMPDVIHFAVEEPFHNGIDLAEHILCVLGSFNRVDKNLDLFFVIFRQNDFDNGIGVHDSRGLWSADHNDLLRG